jgi:hypothetical protein
MRYRLLFAVPWLLPLVACAQGSQLNVPAFAGLKSKATQSVDITIGPVLLKLAELVGPPAGQDRVELKRILAGLKSVRVRSYRFDSDFAYSKSDLEGVRTQLAAPGWTPMVHTQDRERNEDVDVYVSLDEHVMKGLAVVASNPREFTIVDIVGNIDLQDLAKLEQHFGFPGPLGRRNLACEM